jgi:hypothetical protein
VHICAERSKFFAGACEALLLYVAQHYLHAGFSKTLGNSPPNAASSTGDDCNPVLHVLHVDSSHVTDLFLPPTAAGPC